MDINSSILSDGMVLQRGRNIRITGSGIEGTLITVKFQHEEYKCIVQSGKWDVTLTALQTGGPFELSVDSVRETIAIKDILVGDVYLMSGQSNMDLSIQWVYQSFKEEIDGDSFTDIRQFKVPIAYDFEKPQIEVPKGRWSKAEGSDLFEFGAAGYFFAKELYQKYQIPIGLIQTAVPGAPIEAFMEKGCLEEKYYPEFENKLCLHANFIKKELKKEEKKNKKWHEELRNNDLGLTDKKWYEKDYDDKAWEVCSLPVLINDTAIKEKSAIIWFRKDIFLSEDISADGILNLGMIIEEDSAYVNGVCVGSTDYQYPRRRYEVPKEVLQKGINSICVRAAVADSICRFWEKRDYSLEVNGMKYDLTGEWKYCYGTILSAKAPGKTFFEYKPTGVYNAMLAPLISYPISAVLWYQGESNALNYEGYSQKFEKLITLFRKNYKDAQLPFFYVQLANYEEPHDHLTNGMSWAFLREEQKKALTIPNTEMVVSIDAGDETDLHPQDKKTIGYRLSLCARKYIYHDKVSCKSSDILSVKKEEWKVTIFFDRSIRIKKTDEEHISGFEISDEKGRFYPAEAEVGSDFLIVYSKQVKDAWEVRYLWRNNPKGILLEDNTGLPVGPFHIIIKSGSGRFF